MRRRTFGAALLIGTAIVALTNVSSWADLTDQQFFSMLDYAEFPGGSDDSPPGLDDVEAAYLANNLPLAKEEYLEYRRTRTAEAPSNPSRTSPQYFFDLPAEREVLVAENNRKRCVSWIFTGEVCTTNADCPAFWTCEVAGKVCAAGTSKGSRCTDSTDCPGAGAGCVDSIKLTADAARHGKLYLDLKTCEVGEDIDWCQGASQSSCMPDTCCSGMSDLGSWYYAMYRWDWVPDVVWTYLKFQREKYATYLLDDVVADFSDDTTVPAIPTGSGPWRTLEASKRVRHLLDIYHALLFSPSMTAQRHFVLARTVVEHTAYLHLANDDYTRGNFGHAEAAGAALGALLLPEFTDSLDWLTLGIGRVEDLLLTGADLQPADVSSSGWTAEYSADYHEPGTRQFLDVLYLLDRNDVWSDPDVFDPGDTNAAALPRLLRSRHRKMIAAMHRYKAPDNNVVTPNDSSLNSKEDLLGLGAVMYGDGMWRKGAQRPSVRLLGLHALQVYDSIPERDREFAVTLHDPDPTDFIVMRSDADNVRSSSDMLFFNLNDTALPQHDHDDLLNVTLFALSDHVLRDTGVSGGSGFAQNAKFHSVSVSTAYLTPSNYNDCRPPNHLNPNCFKLRAELLERQSAPSMEFAKGVMTTGSAHVTKRSVLYVRSTDQEARPGYAVVADHHNYTDGTGINPVNTYWQFSFRSQTCSRVPCVSGTCTGGSTSCTTNADCPCSCSQLPSCKQDGSKALVAPINLDFFCSDVPTGTLFVLPHHPEEIPGRSETPWTLQDPCTGGCDPCEVNPSSQTIPGTTFPASPMAGVYRFNAAATPTREQILYPQSVGDGDLIPTLTALDPPTSSPDPHLHGPRAGLKASGMRFVRDDPGTSGEDYIDVILINHGHEDDVVVYGDTYETDAQVAIAAYGPGSGLERLLVMDGSLVEDLDIGETLFSSDIFVADFEARFDGTHVNLIASPNDATVTLYAPGVLSADYNGVALDAQEFSIVGDYLTASLDRPATHFSVGPAGALTVWEGSVNELVVEAIDGDGLVDGLYNGTVTLTAPSGTELSAQQFEDPAGTTIGSTLQLTLSGGRGVFHFRGLEPANPLTITASGNLTSGSKSNIVVTNASQYVAPDTTTTSTTTSTSTTTLLLGTRVELFYDGFESDNFTAGGWVEETNATIVQQAGKVFAGLKAAKVVEDHGIYKAQSTAGYHQLEMSYARKTDSREVSDHLFIEWCHGASCNVVEDVTGDVGYQSAPLPIVSLPEPAEDSSDFRIRFRSAGAGQLEPAFIDEVKLTGRPRICQ